MKVAMADLVDQYHRMKREINQVVLETIEAGWFVGGRPVELFSEQLAAYQQVDHVITCGNGTDALQIALMALDVGPGDEVIVPSFTYIASADVIALLGATPVFVDVDVRNFNVDPSEVKGAITDKTKALIVVHLYGQCAPMEDLQAIAEEHGLPIIEDGAQAMGSEYINRAGKRIKSGTLGTIGCTSFYPTKNLGAYGDGGAIMTHSAELAGRLEMIANHGQRKKYHQEIVGVNSRLDTLQAAILSVKLKHLDAFIERKQWIADEYDKRLKDLANVKIPQRMSYSTHSFYQYTLTFDESLDRDKIMQDLAEMDIQTMVYYPRPQHLQEGLRGRSRNSSELASATYLSNHVLSLPIHTGLLVDQIEYVCDSMKKVIGLHS